MIRLIRLMRMCELGELTRECGAATPGLAKIYGADVDDIISIPSPNANWTITSDIILKPGKYWKDMPFVEQKAGLEDEIADAVGGGFKKSIPLKLSKYSPQTNKWINNAIGARFVCIVADNNGQMIVVGDKVASLRLEKAKGTTGQKTGDENGWDMNLAAEGVKPCYFYTGTVVLQTSNPLEISTAPTGQTLTAGGSISLTASVTGGTAPYTHKWRKDGVNISGATAATFSKSGAAAGDTGSYDDVITDSLGATITTTPVTVTVNAVTTFDTPLTFASSTSASAGGVGGFTSATDAELKFEFNARSNPLIPPSNMNIKVSSALQLIIVFPSDYLGDAFKFTDTAGVVHTGEVFTNGDVNF